MLFSILFSVQFCFFDFFSPLYALPPGLTFIMPNASAQTVDVSNRTLTPFSACLGVGEIGGVLEKCMVVRVVKAVTSAVRGRWGRAELEKPFHSKLVSMCRRAVAQWAGGTLPHVCFCVAAARPYRASNMHSAYFPNVHIYT